MRKYLSECGPLTIAFVTVCIFGGAVWQAFYA